MREKVGCGSDILILAILRVEKGQFPVYYRYCSRARGTQVLEVPLWAWMFVSGPLAAETQSL